jgi:hypothetical protein
MATSQTSANNLKGQDYIEWLERETLRQIKVNHDMGTLYVDGDLRSLANAEARVTGDYKGRYLFELLQNANDAITATRENTVWAKAGRSRVRIELTSTALIVANDGVPFKERDVASIWRWGESSKDPNKSIGHKGIGFKSVLEITESPQIFSQVVQFHFDRKTCYAAVRAIVGDAVDLKLPITRFVFPYSIDKLPSRDRTLVSQLLHKEGFATVIRLPLRVDRNEIIERIQSDINPSLLLFLAGIDQIEVRIPGLADRLLQKEPNRAIDGGLGQDITLVDSGAHNSRWLLFDAPKCDVDDRSIIAELEDQTWTRVKKVGFAVAFPLDEFGQLRINLSESSKVFVYFPTELSTGLSYRVHGDFYIDTSRKQVYLNRYNTWLVGQIAAFISRIIVPELADRFPQDVRVVQALVPIIESGGDFATTLRNLISQALRTCRFIPTTSGLAQQPDGVMLAPKGAANNQEEFHRFFSQAELSQLHHNRFFPIAGIEGDTRTSNFLLRIGVKQLTFADIFELLDGRDIVGLSQDYVALYHFLWQWREELKPSERERFSADLQDTNCVITIHGTWIKPHARLYHAKLRQETPSMPRSIQADLVHPAAYDSDGRSGPTYKILDTLQPVIRDYDAPDIICNAIVPLLDGQRFKQLLVEERAEIYRYLFSYWRGRRGQGDPEVEALKGRLLVPARPITNRRRDTWLPVTQVYLSDVWSHDKRLEQIYDGFDDVFFLYDIRGLNLQPHEYADWGQFWQWLGVATAPRILVHEIHRTNLSSGGWQHIHRTHPHAGTKLWTKYAKYIQENFSQCQRHGKGYRQLVRSVTLDGLAKLIERRDTIRLNLLYGLLAEHLPRTNPKEFSGTVFCYRGDCPQYTRTESIPSFFAYVLQEHASIPARTIISGEQKIKLRKPRQCWYVSPAEDIAVRSLLPTPVAGIGNEKVGQFYQILGVRHIDQATISDLIDLIQHLPEIYQDPNLTLTYGRRTVPRAISTLSRWAIGRINNLLISSTISDPLPKDTAIPFIAHEGAILRYVSPPEPVFFADDRYQASSWREHLPFAPLDDNWREAARYLNLHFISECIEEHCVPGMVLEVESEALERRFKIARPYLLAVVNDQRASATQEVARHLSNLEIKVVEDLIVHRQLTNSTSKIIADSTARVYLEETNLPRAGSAGRAPRHGVLYVRKGFEENFDELAAPTAEFVRIPGLADAFVILLDRGGKDGRLKYLATRGLDESNVQAMRTELDRLGIGIEAETIIDTSVLNQHLLNQLRNSEDPKSEDPTESSSQKSPKPSENNSLPGGSNTSAQLVQLPELLLDDVEVTLVDSSVASAVVAEPEPSSRRGGGLSGRDWERDQQLNDIYGRRGEELIKGLEIKRLQALGVPNPETLVRWLREEGYNAADHDLESIDIIGGEKIPIILEVKATPGSDFRISMSRQELLCAQRYQQHYKLYRVIHVATASPHVYLFENPYSLWQQGKAFIAPRDTYVILPDPRRQESKS